MRSLEPLGKLARLLGGIMLPPELGMNSPGLGVLMLTGINPVTPKKAPVRDRSRR
jgi:hypothetical protein